MFTFGILGQNQNFDPLLLLIIAIILDALFGDLKVLFRFIDHPVILIGKVISIFDRKLNREKRNELDRVFRGAFTVFLLTIGSGLFGYSITWLSYHHPLGWVLELFLLTSLLAGRSLYDHVLEVANSLKVSLDDGQKAVAHIVGRNPRALDKFGVARAAIESAAENLSDGVVAPIFWYIIFGFPGLLVYKTMNTMDSMIGHKTPKYEAFGMAAARLDDALNIIPARLTALFIILASFFVPTSSPTNSLKTVIRDSHKHRSLNAGWPEAAMAGALKIALAGPRHYKNSIINDPWIGNGSAKVLVKDISRALYLYSVANLINLGWVSSVMLIRVSLS